MMKPKTLEPNTVVIVDAARTPIGLRDGILKAYTAPQLGGVVVRALLEKNKGVGPQDVDSVIMGNVVGAGLGQGPAKQAAVFGGLGYETAHTLVNTVCSSGLAAVVEGVKSILLGDSEVVVAGGFESMTNAPYLIVPHSRKGERIGEAQGKRVALDPPDTDDPLAYKRLFSTLKVAGLLDANAYDSLVCPFNRNKFMRDYAVSFAQQKGYTIDQVNEAASSSFEKAMVAQESGAFDREIVPVDGASRDQIPPPAKQAQWLANSNDFCSAYNGPFLADAGAAVLLTTASKVRELGLSTMAYVTGYARVDTPPEGFVLAPVRATKLLVDALARAGYSTDFGLIEANESFGVQIPLFEEEFGQKIGIPRINVHGGATALGHPLGAAGARILTTLLYAMDRYGQQRGIAAICFGGGGAFAMSVETAPGR